MQSSQSFRATLNYHVVTVSLFESHLTVTLIAQAQGAAYQQTYDKKHLPSSSKYQFTSCQELYIWLQKYSSYTDNWKVK